MSCGPLKIRPKTSCSSADSESHERVFEEKVKLAKDRLIGQRRKRIDAVAREVFLKGHLVVVVQRFMVSVLLMCFKGLFFAFEV